MFLRSCTQSLVSRTGVSYLNVFVVEVLRTPCSHNRHSRALGPLGRFQLAVVLACFVSTNPGLKSDEFFGLVLGETGESGAKHFFLLR